MNSDDERVDPTAIPFLPCEACGAPVPQLVACPDCGIGRFCPDCAMDHDCARVRSAHVQARIDAARLIGHWRRRVGPQRPAPLDAENHLDLDAMRRELEHLDAGTAAYLLAARNAPTSGDDDVMT